MITYLAINLTNRKFQVGSTVNFNRRCRQHHQGKGDLEFQRSLRKNPENFYWIVSEDDGLETRDEEQYYLDFYHGTVWCYNHNPNAEAPYYEWTEDRKLLRSEKVSGDGNPMFGKRGHQSPHFGKPRPAHAIESMRVKLTGREVSQETRDKQSQQRQGDKFWVNRQGQIKRSKTQPGPEWRRGRKWRDVL